ncbi:GNAT family N-acetyltransferase [Actinomadura darangshiensis]|uniref:GNAT family N-acetyltransferase n=2 Tax=Actinomadura darangshiensis TaxID=705336 RepID=A0A4R5A7U6_9ACTN|nr:GNAT family N-acetyltransferase [Actinomadura darangshiensis]
MDQFYGGATDGKSAERAEQLRQALFGDPPMAYALVAVDGDDLVGIASWSFLWPAVGLTRSLYLKELYVTRSRWRSGVGTLLMQAVFEVAAKNRCSRVEWTTDSDNPDAQEFYAGLGLQQVPSKLFFRADATVIERSLS